MRLTRAEDYSFIFLGEAAKNWKKNPVSVSHVSKKYKISPLFLNKITRELVRGGLVKSKEGKGGGYSLTKHPDKITLKEILQILEGAMHINECDSRCDKTDLCGYQKIWKKLNKKFARELEKITLKEFSDS